ncbi:hypothetical protein M513_04641 [Trichuris suis]|uniref:Uncharacterized protein n=1 Tax=Trichuris suis TaxID=68888 RepID=A0A085MB98_9BILA|nr:hypothetical protein M513_04641 [Trichuris suis]
MVNSCKALPPVSEVETQVQFALQKHRKRSKVIKAINSYSAFGGHFKKITSRACSFYNLRVIVDWLTFCLPSPLDNDTNFTPEMTYYLMKDTKLDLPHENVYVCYQNPIFKVLPVSPMYEADQTWSNGLLELTNAELIMENVCAPGRPSPPRWLPSPP